jgi:hypothetical protein
MASIRESISDWFVTELKGQTDFRVGTVTREPGINIPDLAKTAFPAVLIESANETREDATQGRLSIVRQSTMDVQMTIWFQNKPNDTVRNDFIELLEALYDADRSCGGVAMDLQLVRVEVTDVTESAPYYKMALIWQVQYMYKRGLA